MRVGAREERVEHDRPSQRDHGGIEDRARTDEAIDIRLAPFAALAVLVGVVGDEPRRPMDFGHHRIAGVDAEAALDAANLRTFADVDPRRADGDALKAVDAVARGLAVRMRLDG